MRNEITVFMSEMGEGPRPEELKIGPKVEMPEASQPRAIDKSISAGRRTQEPQRRETATPAPVESKEVQEGSAFDKAVQAAEKGDKDALKQMRESISEEGSDDRGKLEAFDKVIDPESSRDTVLAAMKELKPDEIPVEVVDKLRGKLSDEEIQEWYDGAELPDDAPTDESPDAAPTGEDGQKEGKEPSEEGTAEEELAEEQKTQIEAFVEAVDIKDWDTAKKFLKDLNGLGWKGVKILLKTAFYAACASYAAYCGMMAKTGGMIKK